MSSQRVRIKEVPSSSPLKWPYLKKLVTAKVLRNKKTGKKLTGRRKIALSMLLKNRKV